MLESDFLKLQGQTVKVSNLLDSMHAPCLRSRARDWGTWGKSQSLDKNGFAALHGFAFYRLWMPKCHTLSLSLMAFEDIMPNEGLGVPWLRTNTVKP